MGFTADAARSDGAAPVEVISGRTSGCASPDANAPTDTAGALAAIDGGSPLNGTSLLSAVPFVTIAIINLVSSSPKIVGPGCGLSINGDDVTDVGSVTGEPGCMTTAPRRLAAASGMPGHTIHAAQRGGARRDTG